MIMNRLVMDLRHWRRRQTLSTIYAKILDELTNLVEQLPSEGHAWTVVDGFTRGLDSVDGSMLKLFLPSKFPLIVEHWNTCWRMFEAQLSLIVGIELDDQYRNFTLRLICQIRTAARKIYTPSSAEVVEMPIQPFDQSPTIPDILRQRYCQQAGFMLIRAKRWLKRQRNDISKDSIRILNKLAPNRKVICEGSTSYQHDISDGILYMVKLVDSRCRDAFDPTTYGPASLDIIVHQVPKDIVLLGEMKALVELGTGERCSEEVSKIILEAVVNGAIASIGKHLLDIEKAKRDNPDLSVSLRTGLKAASINAKIKR